MEVFFAALAPSVDLAGALEAVEAGALPAVEAGLGAIERDERDNGWYVVEEEREQRWRALGRLWCYIEAREFVLI